MITLLDKFKPYTKAVGAILLISGTSIGGGMLALPIATAQSGFLPSSSLLIVTWLAMTITAFLLLECNLSSKSDSNLISMSRNTLGPLGEGVAWISYLFLLYALISAYITGASSFLGSILSRYTPFGAPPLAIVSALSVATIMLVVCGIKIIDSLNRILLVGTAFCFFGLLLLTSPNINFLNLLRTDITALPVPLPVLVTAFGYHIVIPSLVQYLNKDIRLLRLSLFVGSLIPLIIYLSWQIAITGSIPFDGEYGILAILKTDDQLGALTKAIAGLKQNSSVYYLSSLFSIFAIITSLLGVALSLWDFLADGLAPYSKLSKNKITLISLTFGPPILVATYFPQAFVSLLAYAGIFVSILLGLLPIAMCWQGRKQGSWGKGYRVPIGKKSMSLCVCFFLLVIVIQCM